MLPPMLRPWLAVLMFALLAAIPARADMTRLLSGPLADHNAIMLLVEPETGAIVDANAAAAEFYGYGIERLRSLRIQDINTLGPDEVAAERRRAQVEKRNYFIFPHRLANGELRTVEVQSAPLREAGGQALLLSVVRDITGKAVADSELTAYRMRLEELVTRRSAEVVEAQGRLRFWMVLGLALQTVLIVALVIAVVRRHSAVKEVAHEAHIRRRAEEKLALANADLQRFAEIAAHHLQEPTRRLMVFSQRLAKQMGPQSDEQMAFSLQTIEEQAASLHAMVRDVQVYLAAASPLGPVAATDPARILEQIHADQRQRFVEAKADLQVFTLPPVRMDTPRLRYLLTALLDNCLRHGHPGGPLCVQVTGERRGNRAVIHVADDGHGIPAEYRGRVLEVFERLSADGVASQRGTGLGLAVVRRIVESCDGHVLIEDSPLGGTLVTIDLPGEPM